MTAKKNTRYPEDYSGAVTEEREGYTLTLLHTGRHYCGYVRFPKRFVREEGYLGILTYVPVHGGITYASKNKDGSMVYGFDCGHAWDGPGDECWPQVSDSTWVMAEADRMARAILLAAMYEKRYLRNVSNKGKAKVLDEFHAACEELHISSAEGRNNFGAIINLLGGEL